jgi:hypothetical protein
VFLRAPGLADEREPLGVGTVVGDDGTHDLRLERDDGFVRRVRRDREDRSAVQKTRGARVERMVIEGVRVDRKGRAGAPDRIATVTVAQHDGQVRSSKSGVTAAPAA